MPMNKSLNKQQLQAAEFLNGICSVIAVPGSGKTRTMMERIGKLVTEHGVAPENILGLTFTRNAADEMRSRLIPILGELSQRVMLSTIHGFCFYLLKREGFVFEILQGKEQMIFVKDILKKLKHSGLSTGMVMCEISLAKNNLVSVEEFKALYEGDNTMKKIAGVYEMYESEKKKRMVMDFDDLLTGVHTLLSENSYVRGKYRSSFQHLLICAAQLIMTKIPLVIG